MLHALCGIHITSYGRVLGAGVLHVTKDLVPCAWLAGRVRRNAGKNKGRLKRVFGQHFLASQVTHRPTVGQDWSEWAAHLVTVFNAPINYFRLQLWEGTEEGPQILQHG